MMNPRPSETTIVEEIENRVSSFLWTLVLRIILVTVGCWIAFFLGASLTTLIPLYIGLLAGAYIVATAKVSIRERRTQSTNQTQHTA